MKKIVLLSSLAVAVLSGCAQLREPNPADGAQGGATGVEAQRPFPTRYKNDHFYPL